MHESMHTQFGRGSLFCFCYRCEMSMKLTTGVEFTHHLTIILSLRTPYEESSDIHCKKTLCRQSTHFKTFKLLSKILKIPQSRILPKITNFKIKNIQLLFISDQVSLKKFILSFCSSRNKLECLHLASCFSQVYFDQIRAGTLTQSGALYGSKTLMDNRTARIRHQYRKTTVLSCHRCLINTC